MIIAPKLKKGDTIAIFSPSSPATATAKTRYLRGKKYLENKGFNILEGSLTGKKDFYRSGTIKERTDELNELIRNPKVNCIMATIGGMNSNSLLPYLDYKQLEKTPKIIIGYSDVTALLLGIYAQIGLVTYYGPAMVASFGEMAPFVDRTYDYFEELLMKNTYAPYEVPTPEEWTDEFINWETQKRAKEAYKNELVTVCQGVAEGRLIGGNLDTLQGIWGSPYMPQIKKGDILLLEDSLKDASTIERSFSLLKLNGVFDRIGGLILGKHEKFDDCGSNRQPYEILKEVMGESSIPILAEFDCCHTHPMITMPIGVRVRLDATKQKVFLIDKFIL